MGPHITHILPQIAPNKAPKGLILSKFAYKRPKMGLFSLKLIENKEIYLKINNFLLRTNNFFLEEIKFFLKEINFFFKEFFVL